MYAYFFKRVIDSIISLVACVLLLPLNLLLILMGLVIMHGNPFFTQQRPGKNEKIFKLIKFRTMNNKKDKDGNLLPDDVRLTKYGKFLRSTSLDELPELFNILKGDMSIVGPRPLLVKYLPYYTEKERHRHDVLPGFTGLAQINGTNTLSWEDKFSLDLEYVSNISFWSDIKIIFKTIGKVFKREGISSKTCATIEDFTDYCQGIGRRPLR